MENENELKQDNNLNPETEALITNQVPTEQPSEENSSNTSQENQTTDIDENNTSNCLELTIKEDYKLTSVVNVAIRSLRMSFKVFVSYVTLNIIKLFF